MSMKLSKRVLHNPMNLIQRVLTVPFVDQTVKVRMVTVSMGTTNLSFMLKKLLTKIEKRWQAEHSVTEAYAYANMVFSTRFEEGPCPRSLKMRPHVHSPSTKETIAWVKEAYDTFQWQTHFK